LGQQTGILRARTNLQWSEEIGKQVLHHMPLHRRIAVSTSAASDDPGRQHPVLTR
jgi:hypothetical protein